MDSMIAFAMGAMNRDKTLMVFDWDKAAELIVEHGARSASAGLSGDWEWTGGDILCDGSPVPKEDTYVYLASTWAPPELKIDGEIFECWRFEGDGVEWTADTYWPDSAREILKRAA